MQKSTKILQNEDYDAEDDDENDDYDEESITEIPGFEKCEEGFRLNENDECVGEYLACYKLNHLKDNFHH